METSEKKPPEHLSIDRPSGWISQFAPLIPEGEVLDLACGAGRHSRFLAGMGYALLAVDRSADSLALAAGQGITTLQVDLESGEAESTWPFAHNRFAGIVVTNYLYRPLFDALVGSLAPNGVLLYETFALGNEQFGKPSNPDFLLAHGELLNWRASMACRSLPTKMAMSINPSRRWCNAFVRSNRVNRQPPKISA